MSAPLQLLLWRYFKAFVDRNTSAEIIRNQGAIEPAAQQLPQGTVFISRTGPSLESALRGISVRVGRSWQGGTFTSCPTTPWIKFLAAARSVPKYGAISTSFLRAYRKNFRAGGSGKGLSKASPSTMFTMHSTFNVRVLFIKYFNDLGQYLAMYVEAEGCYRLDLANSGAVLRAQQQRGNGSAYVADKVRVS